MLHGLDCVAVACGRTLWRSAGAHAGVRPNGRPRLRSAQIAPAGMPTVGREACKGSQVPRAQHDPHAGNPTSQRQHRGTGRLGSAITRCLCESGMTGGTTDAVVPLSLEQPRLVAKRDPDASLPLPTWLPLLTWRDIASCAEHGLHGRVRFVDTVDLLHASKRTALSRRMQANSKFAHGRRNCTRPFAGGSMRTEKSVRWVPSAFPNSSRNLKRYSWTAPLVNQNAQLTLIASIPQHHVNRAQKPNLRAFQSPFTAALNAGSAILQRGVATATRAKSWEYKLKKLLIFYRSSRARRARLRL